MSAAAAEPIRAAADLDLPANLASLGKGLPLEAVAQFASELLAAIHLAQRTNDLTGVQATIRRWQLISKALGDPRWPGVAAWASSDAWQAETPMTVEELRTRLAWPA